MSNSTVREVPVEGQAAFGPSLPGIASVLQVFFYYVILANGILGLLNNTLSSLVFTIYRTKFPPSCLYFIVLSVTDFFCCWFLCILFWTGESLRQMGGRSFDLFTLSLSSCKSLRYLQQIFISTGAYSVVVLSYERAACLVSPVRFLSFFTVRRRVAMLSSVVLFAAVLWTQTFIAFDIRSRFVNSSLTGCYPSTKESVSFILAYSYEMIFVNYTVPALLILGGNILALIGYRMNRIKQAQQSELPAPLAGSAVANRQAVENGVKVTMVMLSMQYLILNMPYSISWPLFSFLKYFKYELTDPTMFYNASYLNSIFMVLSTVNYSVNFYFYLFKVRRFRRYLLRLLGFNRCEFRRNRRSSSSGNVNAAPVVAGAACRSGGCGSGIDPLARSGNYRPSF